MSTMDKLISENISNNKKTTKSAKKRIQVNNKIILNYFTRLQENNSTLQDLTKTKVGKQLIKIMKTKVNRHLKKYIKIILKNQPIINTNIEAVKKQKLCTKKKEGKNHSKITKTSFDCRLFSHLIVEAINKQPVKIKNFRIPINWRKCITKILRSKRNEKLSNQPLRTLSNQPALELSTVCLKTALNYTSFENSFSPTKSFNTTEFSDMLKSSSSPDGKIFYQKYACNNNHNFNTCLENNFLQPDHCTLKENHIHNLEKNNYEYKNKNYEDDTFNPLLLQCLFYRNSETQALFFKVNELKKLETYHSEMTETEKKRSFHELNLCMTKKMSCLPETYSKITKSKETQFLYDIPEIISKIEKEIEKVQKSHSKITNVKNISEIYSKIIKAEALQTPNEICSKTTYKRDALNPPKTNSEVTTKFRLSLPITFFKKSKKKITQNKLYSEITKTEQESPPNKLYHEAGKEALIPYSNFTEIKYTQCLPKTYFDITVKKKKNCIKTYSKMNLINRLQKSFFGNNLKNKLSSRKTYFGIIEHNTLVLLQQFSEKNIKDQQYQPKIYSNKTIQDKPSVLKTYSEATIKSNLSSPNTYFEAYVKEQLSVPKKYSEENLSPPNTYFEITVKKKLSLPNTHVKEELSQPNQYSKVAVINELNLLKANPDVCLKEILSLPYTLSEVTVEKKLPLPNTYSVVKENLDVSNTNSEMDVMDKQKSLKLNPQQVITDEADETTTIEIISSSKKKLVFVTNLGLLSNAQSEEKTNVKSILPKKKKTYPKVISLANGHNTEQSNHDQSSSERVKDSYLLKYSNVNNGDQNHTAIPVLIPAANPLGSLIHKDRSCTPECSSCNKIFGLEDTPFHIAQIKNPDKQKLYLENANHLIGLNSCLCIGCYQAMEKRSSTKNTKRVCIIMNCNQTASHIFNSKWMTTLKSILLINKINFRVQTNEEEALHKISFCNAHYDQMLVITQCQLCGNQTIQKFKLQKSVVHEYQLILDEDKIPVTIKYDILICKPCHIYLLLRRDKSTNISSELEKHCDAAKTRIINNNILKIKELERIKLEIHQINTKKKKEDDQLLMVTSLPTNKSNIFTTDNSIASKPESSVLELVSTTTPPPSVKSTSVVASIQSLTAIITTTTVTAPLTTITSPLVETPITSALTKTTEDVKLTAETSKLPSLTFKRKRQPKFLDEHPPVPRTKKGVVNLLSKTTDCIKHTMLDHKLTIPVHKSTITGVQSTTSVDKPTISVDKPTTSVDKPTISVDKPTASVDKPTISVDKPTISVDKHLYNKSPVFSPVLRPFCSSQYSVPMIPIHKPTIQVVNPTILVDKPKIADHKPVYSKSLVFSPVLRPFFSSKYSVPAIPIHKPTIQIVKPTIQTVKHTTPVDKPKIADHKLTIPDHKPTIAEHIPMIADHIPTIPVDESTTDDHKPLYNKSQVFSPVLRPFLSSKCCVPKKLVNTPESVSPIKKPTRLQTNQSLKNTLDSQSTSLRTEVPELSLQQAKPSALLSTIPDMIQLFENLKSPYPSGIAFINHLLNLETCRNLGNFIVGNNTTVHCQQTSSPATTPSHTIHCLPEHEKYQTISRTDDVDNSLTNDDFLSNKCVPSDDHNNTDSLFIHVKATSKSYSVPKQKSISPKNVVNKQSQYNNSGDSKNQVIPFRTNATATNCPTITVADTTSTNSISIKTTEVSINTDNATSPVFSTVVEAIKKATTATNTTDLITAVADSTTAIMNTEVPVTTDIVTINSDKSDITSTVNDNTTVADATATEVFTTLHNTIALSMITSKASTTTNAASTVSSVIDADSLTASTTTVTDDTTSAKINTESSTITNANITESHTSAITTADALPTVNSTINTSDITTTTAITITASTIFNSLPFMSDKKTVSTIPIILCMYAKGTMLKYLNASNQKSVTANSIISIIIDGSNNSTPIPLGIVKASIVEQLFSSKLMQISTFHEPKHPFQLTDIKLLSTNQMKSTTVINTDIWKFKKI